MEELTRPRKLVLVAVLLLGAATNLAGVRDPLAVRHLTSWREGDVGAIARNYVEEGMNPFLPRIDWRDDGPGYVESEFPIYPYSVALLGKAFGHRDEYARWFSATISVVTLLVFAGFALRLLPWVGAIGAIAFYAVNPAMTQLGTAAQPEPLMLLASLLAMLELHRWFERGGKGGLLRTAGWTALAMLVKATAAHLGIVVAFAVLWKHGVSAFRRRTVWIAAAIALLPPLLWYGWARYLWITYGNSLGISNEYHWFGPDLLTRPSYFLGLAKYEITQVLGLTGIVFLGLGLLSHGRKLPLVTVWLASVWLFYLVSLRTTSPEAWAFYYHSLSSAPACLLMGAGLTRLEATQPDSRIFRLIAWGTAAAGVAVAILNPFRNLPAADLLRTTVAGSFLLAPLAFRLARDREVPGTLRHRVATCVVPATLLLLFTFDLGFLAAYDGQRHAERFGRGRFHRARDCADGFQAFIPEGEKIVFPGGRAFDEGGFPVAYDESWMFYFLHRKGFVFPQEEYDLGTLEEIAARGGRFLLFGKELQAASPQLASEILSRFPRLADCGDYFLLDLHAAAP